MSVAPHIPSRVLHAVMGVLRPMLPFSSTTSLLQARAGRTARPCSECVKGRYLNGSAPTDEQSCRGEFGYQSEDGVFEKGVVGDMKEAGLALALGAEQGIVGAERSDGGA